MSTFLNKRNIIIVVVIVSILFCLFCPEYLNTFISEKDNLFVRRNINTYYKATLIFVIFSSMVFFFIFFRYIKGNNSDAKRIFLSVCFSLLIIILFDKIYNICNLWGVEYYKIYSTVIKDKEVRSLKNNSSYNNHYFFAYSLDNNKNNIEWIELKESMFAKHKVWKKLNRGSKISIYYYKGHFSEVEQIVFEK